MLSMQKFKRMKPTEKQIAICNAIIREVSWWRDSNDIESPTLYADMGDCLSVDIDDIIGESVRMLIQQKLEEILYLIKQNK